MPRIKLTKANVAKLKAPDPSGKQVLHWDIDLKGFGVLCSGKTNAKTFVVQQRMPDGRVPRVTIGSVEAYLTAGQTIDDARKDAAQTILDMSKGVDPKQRKTKDATLADMLDAYLAARPRLSQRSQDGYRGMIEAKFDKWLDKPMRQITPAMIEARYREIKDEVAIAKERRLKARKAMLAKKGITYVANDTFVAEPGAATANSALRALRATWKFATTRIDDLPEWPGQRLRGQWFDVPRREKHVPTNKLGDFYACLDRDDLLERTTRDFIKLLLFTGLRRKEAATLEWADVDLQEKVIRLSAKRTKSGRKLDLPMSDVVHSLLVARRALGLENKFVFPGNGRSGHLEEPKKSFMKIADKTGVSVTPHALRSTFITVASNCPMSIYHLKGLVNHSVGSDVTGGYVQLSVDMLRDPMQQVTDRLKQHCGIDQPDATNVVTLGH